MKSLIFDKARIAAVEHKVANSNVTSRIKVIAILTPEVATAMEARWVLFDREQSAKAGYKSVELDYELKNFRLTLVVPKMEDKRLDMTSELATDFKVIQKGDGKRKPKRLMVQFKVSHAGSPFEMLEWLIKVGGAEGQLELEPLQQQLFVDPDDQKKAKKKEFPAQEPIEQHLNGPALASHREMQAKAGTNRKKVVQ